MGEVWFLGLGLTLPFSFLPSPFLHSLLALEVGPLPSLAFPFRPFSPPFSYIQGVWGSAVSSPSGIWGGAPAEIEFVTF